MFKCLYKLLLLGATLAHYIDIDIQKVHFTPDFFAPLPSKLFFATLRVQQPLCTAV